MSSRKKKMKKNKNAIDDAPRNDDFLRDTMIGAFMTFDFFFQVCVLPQNVFHFTMFFETIKVNHLLFGCFISQGYTSILLKVTLRKTLMKNQGFEIGFNKLFFTVNYYVQHKWSIIITILVLFKCNQSTTQLIRMHPLNSNNLRI